MVIFYLKNNSKKTLRKIWNVIEKGSSRTRNLGEVTRRADILVVAIGRPKFVTAVMVRDGAVVIDVGVNRDPETGKLCGDVDFAAIEPKASVITPVPGGVGPMTICCLMENTIECFLRRIARK